MNTEINNNSIQIPGQITVFDVLNSTEGKQKKRNLIKCGASKEESIFTLSQKIVYKRYLGNLKVLRVVCYYGGYIRIETEDSGKIEAHYIDKQGNEFSCIKRLGVLPFDKIIYYSGFEIKETTLQKERLQELLVSDKGKIKRIIKRKGDINILIVEVYSVKSILPNGWVLEFSDIKLVDCEKEELARELILL